MDKENKEKREEILREARIKMIKTASVVIAVAIVLACYAYTQLDNVMMQMTIYIVSSFISTVAGLFIFGALALGREAKNRHNFFLYERKSKTDIPVSSLTVKRIREKLLEFMSIFKRRGKLYIGDLFDENPSIPEHFKPLFCYEILYEIATDDGINASAFLSFGGECADIFTKYLRWNEDYELANKLRVFITDFSAEQNNSASFKAYIQTKKEYIEEKMLSYTVKNIDKFN